MKESPYARPRGSPAIHRHVLLLQSFWDDRVLRGVARYAAEHRWVLDSSMRAHHRLPPLPWKGDGIISYCGMGRPDMKMIKFLRKAALPVVETQGKSWVPGSGQVKVSNEAIGRMGAEHFLRLNFQHIGFVTFEENDMETPRRMAFQQRVEAGGGQFHALSYGNLIAEVAALPRPVGLMATNDFNAINVCLALDDAGYRVPEEYSILGVDDTEIVCELALIPLSSINCNYEEQGYKAAALLDRMMNGEGAPEEPIVIEPKGITLRRSTDTVAMRDRDSALFLRYLRDHYLENQTMDRIARQLGVSLRKVQFHFKKDLKVSLLDELTRLRVDHAKKLLANRKLKIEAIAVDSGFSSRFHFIRAFQRITGHTPTSYRRRRQGKERGG